MQDRPRTESDFVPLFKQKPFSKDDSRPYAGQLATLKIQDRQVSVEIISYFDDADGVEHVLIKNGPISMIRRTVDLV